MSTHSLKTMLLIIAVLVAITAGLTFMGGAKGTNPDDNQQQLTANREVSVCPADCDKPCCKEKKDSDKCPADCDKPCCKKEAEKCHADCDKTCCKKQSLSCCGF